MTGSKLDRVEEGASAPTTAASGNLGYTWGKFNVTSSDHTAPTGYYIRVWTRKADGSWQLVADVATPSPAA